MDRYGNLTPLSPVTEPTTIEPTTVESTTVEPSTAEPTTAEPTTAEPTTAEPTTLEPTTVEPSTAERILNIHSVSNTFDSADYSIKLTGNNDRVTISYYWNNDISIDSYKWNMTYDKEKLKCYTYMTDRGAVNEFVDGNITSTWSNPNNPLVFAAGDEFASFSFDLLSDGDTTITFNIDDIVKHQEIVPTTTEEPTTIEPTTIEPTTAEPSTAEPTTVEPSTAESTVAPTTDPYAQYIIGDVNGDGFVDVLDATLVQKYSSEKSKFNDRQIYVADVNDDGNVDVLDAATIQKYAADKIQEFRKK